MNDLKLSADECRQKNRETGMKYAELSNRMDILAQKFKKHNEDETEKEWDFGKLYEIYSDLAARMSAIGDRLCSC